MPIVVISGSLPTTPLPQAARARQSADVARAGNAPEGLGHGRFPVPAASHSPTSMLPCGGDDARHRLLRGEVHHPHLLADAATVEGAAVGHDVERAAGVVHPHEGVALDEGGGAELGAGGSAAPGRA